jgi:hypothetical protein
MTIVLVRVLFLLHLVQICFDPFLIIKFYILPVFTASTVCLTNRWRIMGQKCVTVITKVLGHY